MDHNLEYFSMKGRYRTSPTHLHLFKSNISSLLSQKYKLCLMGKIQTKLVAE